MLEKLIEAYHAAVAEGHDRLATAIRILIASAGGADPGPIVQADGGGNGGGPPPNNGGG